MKKLTSFVLVLLFMASQVSAQALSGGTLIDKTGTDFFFYWYVGTIGKQITVDSEGQVHVTYTKSYVTDTDTGYQVMYQNVTTGTTLEVPSQDEAAEIMPAVSFIGGGKDGSPVYIYTGVGGRGYNYGPAMHLQAMSKVNDAGDGIDNLGLQTDKNYYADNWYANPFAMEVDNAQAIAHCVLTNPSGSGLAYWNFDGTSFGEIYQMYFADAGSDVPGRNIAGALHMNALEGADLAINSDGSEVAIVGLHSFNQIWVHKGTFGGNLWDDDFFAGMDAGTIIPLWDTTAAKEWLPDLYNANAARPYNDAQVVYDADDNLVVVYTATYREHWIDTAGGGQMWGPNGFDTWWRDHGSWPGDHDAMFYDGSSKAKPTVMSWTETSGTHNVVAEAMYPMAGETFEWFAYGVSDSGYGMFGNAYADGIIGNLELVANNNGGEGEPKFILLFEQMGAPAQALVDAEWSFSHEYYAYNNDVFSVVSNDGVTWTNEQNLTQTADLDENDVSAVVDNGTLHVMWTSDNMGGRDRVMCYVDENEDKYTLWTGHGIHFSYPIRVNEADQAEILYKAVPVADLLTAVEDVVVPGTYTLAQNYPNPFNPSTSIAYSIPSKADVTLKVYNNVGQLVATLVNGVNEAGVHEVNWNASNVASGVYYYTIKAGDFTSTKKMMLLK
ncbi:MAG: T9SS type A sorting domain-containing protein [Ignavibacteriae bacterium]|nr:T9SS type A sorting domain-containing protein [Ignavibacteriota bacterium]